MMLALTLVAFAALVLLVGIYVLRGGRLGKAAGDFELLPLDLEAFLNLVDPGEEQFLKENLPPAEFRSIQRERLGAAVEYVSAVSHNAATLLRIGAAARHSADVQVAEAGQTLMNRASQLRVRAQMAKVKFYVGMVLPGMELNPLGVAEGYRQISELAAQLGKMPARGEMARVG